MQRYSLGLAREGVPIFKISRGFGLLFVSFLVAGCAATVQHHGVLIEEAQLSRLKIGQSTQKEVLEILGSPSSVPPFDQESVWFYVSRTTETVTFFTPELIDSSVYVLTFSPQGLLQKMTKIENDKTTEISPVKRTTPSVGHTAPVMKQLFRNLGKKPAGASKTGS